MWNASSWISRKRVRLPRPLRPRPGHPYFAGGPLLIAHRGGAALAPENTLEAFRQALEWWNADILELDVHASRDGEVVVIHDNTVDRTTDGAGRVNALPLAELQARDAGYRFVADGGRTFPYRGQNIRIPTLRAVLDAFPRARVNIEIKAPDARAGVAAVIRQTGSSGRVLIAAGRLRNRLRIPSIGSPTSASREELYLFQLFQRAGAGRIVPLFTDALQMPERHNGRQVLTRGWIRTARARNVPVHVWTINEMADRRRLLEWGARGILTDRPDRLAALLHDVAGRPDAPGPPPGAAPPAVECLLRL